MTRFDFDALDYPYASRRHAVFAKNGMACAGNPHCASVGLQTLLKGGNAIDAAIAMAASQPVFEPTGNGLGADCFAMVWRDGKLFGINGSGPAPAAASIEAMKARAAAAGEENAEEKIPSCGVLPVDVPGAVAAWAALHERFGSMPFAALLEPAARYAEAGYPVSPNIARWMEAGRKRFEKYKGRSAFEGFFRTFMRPDGSALRPGEIFRSAEMAATLRLIGATKGEAFYRGALAERIAAYVEREGGFLTAEDLARYRPEWVEPISVNYRGVDVWELPPNGQGVTVLMALKILAGMDPGERGSAEAMHRQIEAVKLALADGAAYVADPKAMTVRVQDLLSDAYAAKRRALIGSEAKDAEPGMPPGHSTVYFCAADRFGNMVSMIQSNFRGFGAGTVVPGTGIALNDRGEYFSLDPKHPNALAGGKRPYHTIIPGFLTKDGEALGPFGIMGGLMQPQAHVQVLMQLLDWGMNPQAALDAPRWQWTKGRSVMVEQDVPNSVVRLLQRRGHDVTVNPDGDVMGRGQMILRNREGVLCGATEKRTDGQIMCF